MAVSQYPDSAVFTITTSPVQNSSGDWTAPTGTSFTTDCRAEFNSRAGTLTMTDGEVVNYDYIVYQRTHTTEIEPGTAVTLTLHSGRTVTGEVKRHENNQLNSKSWV